MSPHQSFPLWRNASGKVQHRSAVRVNCYAVHTQATYIIYTGVLESCTVHPMQYTPTSCTTKDYTTASSTHSVRSRWSCSRLHGSPPTNRIDLPPDKGAECPRLLIPPAGRDDPPDKEITYNCMNGSPGDPAGTVVQQSKQKENRPFHNPSRGRSVRQGGRMGDNYRRYKTCH